MAKLNLDDIQGNLLLGYKFGHVAHLFGEVREQDPRNLSSWRAFIDRLRPELTRAEWSVKPEATVNLGLSYRALAALQPTLAKEIGARFAAFREGMPSRASLLGDGAAFRREAWEGRDVWLSIHAREPAALEHAKAELLELSSGLFASGELRGSAIAKDGHWYEHFGFRDDISYPAFDGIPTLDQEDIDGRGKLIGGAWQALATGEFVLGEPNESGEITLAGLSTDAQTLLRNGTFAVFRHLQQHVDAFRRYLSQVAGKDADFVAERMMGRKRDGTPLVPVAAGSRGTSIESNFSYQDDPRGSKCPLGAHVRRANPRLADGRHRIIRRGMPFGEPIAADQPETDPVGLLFVAFNASIEEQFEFVQRVWCNGAIVNNVPEARDPIGSARPERSMMIEGDVASGRAPRPLLEIPQFVTCLGGQYYLYPSLAGLRLLAASPYRSSSQSLRASP